MAVAMSMSKLALGSEYTSAFGSENGDKGHHQQGLGVGAESVACSHLPAVAEEVGPPVDRLADGLDSVGKRYVAGCDPDVAVKVIVAADVMPAFHLAGVYDPVGHDEIVEDAGY